ncbi:hypothetical protein SAMN04488126_11761 [Bhargavaea beijingensis]|uniref:Uncharacterized protein n=1 Tax=Bhargavaea beijingensis TaxID=426756 RepID=A0A1G7FA40_9BACL|nr:hypothetical protein SAMN04488126_11761 [Bhargavaea beijingensis]
MQVERHPFIFVAGRAEAGFLTPGGNCLTFGRSSLTLGPICLTLIKTALPAHKNPAVLMGIRRRITYFNFA